MEKNYPVADVRRCLMSRESPMSTNARTSEAVRAGVVASSIVNTNSTMIEIFAKLRRYGR